MSKSEKLISVEAGYQYSVNIAYDLHSAKKIAGFIPTRSAENLWLEVLQSTRAESTERSRVLVAPYGRGKSHLVLTMLALLERRDLTGATSLTAAIEHNTELKEELARYQKSGQKLLPIVVAGTSNSISQAFLLALERALRDNELAALLPDTNYLAAIRTINRWKNDYPATYEAFAAVVSCAPDEFLTRLKEYDASSYAEFERVYPTLTAGGVFNPFLGFDVVELYQSVLRGLKTTDYTGIFVVYDEFSKFLEANIASASATDMKVLQDFAEMCNRSGEQTAEIMLIAHKDIENYIGELPRQRIDGWRAVANRFRHVRLSSDYAESYEIMQAVIKHNPILWEKFNQKYGERLDALVTKYSASALFRELSKDELARMVGGAYPLHPLASFILPRLSERVAQNERTLFTFLAADGDSTLRSFLRQQTQAFSLLTPDYIFDYFRPLLAKETGALHDLYVMAERILAALEDELAIKIIKNIALIYMLEQFECLAPMRATVIDSLADAYPLAKIEATINELIEQKYILYLKRSNGFLALKQSSGVDIRAKITDMMERHRSKSTRELATALGLRYYIYPAQYNDEREMTRYFSLELLDSREVTTAEALAARAALAAGDGVIYALVVDTAEELARVREVVIGNRELQQVIFALPTTIGTVREGLLEMYAARELRTEAGADAVLVAEYALVYDDLYELQRERLAGYIYPERGTTVYYHLGCELRLHRRAELSALATKICDFVYTHTPIINNEVVNKNTISLQAIKSRLKVLAAILRPEVEPDLGLVGFGQDVSIMRSTLLRTGILAEVNGAWDLRLVTGNENMDYLLGVINDFIRRAGEGEALPLKKLYDELMGTVRGLGVRRGVIPIYIAVLLRRYRDSVLIYEGASEQPLTAETLQRLNERPEQFALKRLAWSEPRTEYIVALAGGLGLTSAADYKSVARALQAWYLSLPKYSRERKKTPQGKSLPKASLKVMRTLRTEQNAGELLFTKLPEACGGAPSREIAERLLAIKAEYDGALSLLERYLAGELYRLFSAGQDARASLPAVLLDWSDTLGAAAFSRVYDDATGDFLSRCRAGDSEQELVQQIARLATGLRLMDWADTTIERFTQAIADYKATAEQAGATEATASEVADTPVVADGYSVTFVDASGQAKQRNFARTEYSRRAKLLLNNLIADVEAMGTSITEAEKRQVIIEVLEKFC